MKKLFTILLAVTMAVTCFGVFASAANPSPEGAITAITGIDASQSTIVVTRDPFTGNVAEYNRILEELKQTNSNYTILDKRNVVMNPAEYSLPIKLELSVTGVKEGQEGYVIYTDKNGAVKKVAATVTDGKMVAVIDSYLSALAIAVANKTTSTPDTPSQPTSPVTASTDAAVPFALAAAVLLAAAAAYSMKKIKD